MKPLFLLLLTSLAALAVPRFQIVNGTEKPIKVYRLNDEERVLEKAVGPKERPLFESKIGETFVVTDNEGNKAQTVRCKVPVQGFRYAPEHANGIPPFYTQRTKVGGFPIVASKNVNPYALKEAAFIVEQLIGKRPDVRQAMVDSGAQLSIIAWNEFTTDLPEFSHYEPKDYWDARARGTGGSITDPYCSCAEENVLGYPGDPYSSENILIHEFAHNVHLRGMVNVDPTFDSRLEATYDKAMKAGLWKGKYASVNSREYFAEGVQSWFNDNRENDHDHNHVNTRKELLDYDAGLAALCREVFRDTEFAYTKPATRLTGHLEGYDPSEAPTFIWPERLQKTKAEIRAKAEARSKAGTEE